MNPNAANPVFCALDTVDLRQTLDWGRAVKSFVGGLKIALEFFNANRPEGITAASDPGAAARAIRDELFPRAA